MHLKVYTPGQSRALYYTVLQIKSEFLLDSLRSIAALLVLLSHWRILLFQDFPTLENPSAPVKLFYFITGIGRPSVMVFFVLSGYLVTGSALRAMRKGTWSISRYLNQRITRLWVVLIPSLLLCWAWDAIGLKLYPDLLYDGTLKTIAIMPGVAARHGFLTMLQNMFFLQGITSMTYGTNDPLWSLSYEFWYYILLIPLLLLTFRAKLSIKLLSGACLAGGLLFVGAEIRNYFSIWLLGAVIAWLMQSQAAEKRRFPTWALALSTLLLTATLIAMRARVLPFGMRGDLAIAMACALFIWVVVHDRRTIASTLLTRSVKSLASWSYSLYLLHLPILVFLASVLFRNRQWAPDTKHLALALALLLVVMLYAYLISLLTERNTNSVREFITHSWARRGQLR